MRQTGQGMAWHGKARQGKARQGKARQGKARQGKARQGKARQGKARQGKARHSRRGQRMARLNKLTKAVLSKTTLFTYPSLSDGLKSSSVTSPYL